MKAIITTNKTEEKEKELSFPAWYKNINGAYYLIINKNFDCRGGTTNSGNFCAFTINCASSQKDFTRMPEGFSITLANEN